ncbi:MAG: RNA polymerase sigma factor [bacterium]|nr:RNA polymerase sigma factor [bacterium]
MSRTAKEREFTEAYEQYADQLFRHCYFRISDRERALELVQEAFMKTWDVQAKGEEIQNWRAYLFRVLNNLIIDEYRKKKSLSLDALLESDGVTEGSFEDLRSGSLQEVVEKIDTGLEVEQLRGALQELPDSYKQVVVLRYIDHLSPKDIAHMLDENENAVSVRIHRALAKLRNIVVDIRQEHE